MIVMIYTKLFQQHTGDKTRISVDSPVFEAPFYDVRQIWLWHKWKKKMYRESF